MAGIRSLRDSQGNNLLVRKGDSFAISVVTSEVREVNSNSAMINCSISVFVLWSTQDSFIYFLHSSRLFYDVEKV